jgi:hypothetical protein
MNDRAKSVIALVAVTGALAISADRWTVAHFSKPTPAVVSVEVGLTYQDGRTIGFHEGYDAGFAVAKMHRRSRATLRDVERDWGIEGRIPREVRAR